MKGIQELGNVITNEQVILVVEDDVDLCQLMRWTLEDEGLTVETAGDGQEALKRAMQRRPALVILDMGLPRLSGEGVADILHTMYSTALPIITVTADGRAAEKAKRIGAVSYLNKPFELEVLIKTVWDALGNR